MAIISPETVEEVRSKADILVVIGESVQLQRRGSNYVGLCCFHSEKSPSFSVNPQRQHYHCFGCGASGDAITFVMETEGVSFPDAIRRLAEKFNIEIRETNNARQRSNGDDRKIRSELFAMNALAANYFTECARRDWNILKPFVQSRGLQKESIQNFALGYASLDWSGLADTLTKEGFSEESILRSGLIRRSGSGKIFDLFRGRFIFPIHADNGRDILAFGARLIPGLQTKEEEGKAPKYINSPETAIYKKSATFYGIPQAKREIRSENLVYIVEGYMDVIGFHQVGIHNILAACGTAFTSQHVDRLKHLSKRVHFVFDGDSAGRTAAGKVFPLFINSGIDARVIFLNPEDDPDSLALREGENTKRTLEEAASSSLLRAYVEYLLHQEGLEGIEQLGAARKGRLVESLAELIQKVTNRYERRELAQEAAFLFRVSEEELAEDVVGDSSPRSRTPEKTLPESSALESEEGAGVDVDIVGIEELHSVDQEILRLAMVGKAEMIVKIFEDADLCYFLHPHTQLFLENLAEAFLEHGEKESALKEEIQELLLSFGPSWKAHWREAFQLYGKSSKEMLEKIYLDCKVKLRVRRAQDSLRGLDEDIQEAQSEEERGRLMQQKVLCERRIRELQKPSKK